MKRKTILTIAMCFFAVVVLFGVFYLNNPDIFSRDDGEESDQPNYMSMTRYPVNGGEVAHTFTAKGAVISNSRDVYVTKISVAYGKPDSFTMRAGRGEDISAGDVLYILDGTAVKSDINARVLEIGTNESGAEISLLNYDSLYAVLQIKAERLSEISYDTKVEVEIDGKKYPSQIRDIGFEVSGGNVMLAVSVPPKVLPGSEVNAILHLK